MFEAEADGLRELRDAGEVRVPEVIDCGSSDGESYLLLERFELGRCSPDAARLFGQQLARLHRHTRDRFGWYRDNTIGPTPQHNEQCTDWAEFFRKQRLGFQLDLAAANGYGGELQDAGAQLMESCTDLFDDYQPAASLLHGDLWGGNWGCVGNEPVTFDPAVYFGDRETDVAMTMLFGGFGREFHAAYEAAWPMAEGHEQRIVLYQLYHVLNHLNLFGRGYLGQALSLIKSLC